MKKVFLSVSNYARQHFGFPLNATYVVIVLLIMFVFQSFLRQEYLNYLLQESYSTNRAVVSAEQSSLNVMVASMIQVGSEIATDDLLYTYVRNAKEEDNQSSYYLRSQLKLLSSHSDSILELALVREDGLWYQYNKNRSTSYPSVWMSDSEEGLRALYQEIFAKINDTTERYEVATSPQTEDGCLLHIAYPVIGRQVRLDTIDTMLVVTYRLDMVEDFLDIQTINNNTYTIGYIADENDRIIYHADADMTGRISSVYLTENHMTGVSGSIEPLGWQINVAVDNVAIRERVDALYQNATAVYLVVLLAGMVFLGYMIKRSLRPVEQIDAAMKTVRAGELNQKIEIHGEHEIWKLAEHYNKMVDSLKEQQKRTYEENRQKLISIRRANEAEREALESQINAHFICNTLGAIHYNAIETGNEEISVMLRKLSNILRYTFSRSYENVTVAQELAWVEQYLYLQKFRLMDVFDYTIEFPEEYEEWPCCKLFLQPFVENSIIHGFEGREEGGCISILGGLEGGRLKITLRDNGNGIPRGKVAAIREILLGNNDLDFHGIGIGIRNVVARLRMFFGEQFSIVMQTRENEGTEFIFRLPIPSGLLYNEEDDEMG